MTIETWSERVGRKGRSVTVYERPDRGLTIWLRWTERGKVSPVRADIDTVRDSRGRLSKRLQDQARAEAYAKLAELEGGPAKLKKKAAPLTLGEGVRLAFSERGPYPLDPKTDRATRDARRSAELAVQLLGGPDVAWQDVTPGMIRAIWRRIARKRPDLRVNTPVKAVGALFRIAEWLAVEQPEARFPRPWRGWRSEVQAHWRKLDRATEPNRPRYSVEERDRLWQVRDQADPRFRLALVIGAGQRQGQTIGAFRRHAVRRADGWRIDVPYVSRRKRAAPLLLTEVEAAALEYEMAEGYLADLERAFQAGEIEDYALFPHGKLKQGRVPVSRATKPLHRRTLSRWHQQLEEVAGVEHVAGRGLHGLRRLYRDLYRATGADPMVRNVVQGWAPGSTIGDDLYADSESEAVLREAAALRDRVRGTLSEGEG